MARRCRFLSCPPRRASHGVHTCRQRTSAASALRSRNERKTSQEPGARHWTALNQPFQLGAEALKGAGDSAAGRSGQHQLQHFGRVRQ